MENEEALKIFTGKTDVFSGITLSTDEQSWEDADEFKSILIDSLHYWERASVRGVWVKIPLHQADLVGVISKLGFEFHHAQPSYVMMTKWLPKDEPNMLPGYASHYLGAGGFVLNKKNQMLVIQELFAKKRLWKLPGGAVDPGEDLPTAVCREVLEETGVSTEFLSVGCFRHFLQFRFGRSDIYFVCQLRPLTEEINLDPKEIAHCRWMDIEEFLNHSEVHEMNKYFVRQCLSGLSEERSVSLHPVQLSNGCHVYSVLPKSDQEEEEATPNRTILESTDDLK